MHPISTMSPLRIVTVTVMLAATACASLELPREMTEAMPPRGVLIARSLGAVDGVSGTNSLEAFEHSYRAGARWFQVDLALTASGDLVCFRAGAEPEIGLTRPVGKVPTGDFLHRRWGGRFTLMTLATLLDRADIFSDAVLVVGPVSLDDATASAMRAALAGRAQTLRRRVVPQVFRVEDLARVREVFGEVPALFTLSLDASTLEDREVRDVVRQFDVPVVAMSTERIHRDLARSLHKMGRRVLVGTVDSPAAAVQLAGLGADGFFTDSFERLAPRR